MQVEVVKPNAHLGKARGIVTFMMNNCQILANSTRVGGRETGTLDEARGQNSRILHSVRECRDLGQKKEFVFWKYFHKQWNQKPNQKRWFSAGTIASTNDSAAHPGQCAERWQQSAWSSRLSGIVRALPAGHSLCWNRQCRRECPKWKCAGKQ